MWMLSVLIGTACSLVSFSVLMTVVCRFIVSRLLHEFGGVSVRSTCFLLMFTYDVTLLRCYWPRALSCPAYCYWLWPIASNSQPLTCKHSLLSADCVIATQLEIFFTLRPFFSFLFRVRIARSLRKSNRRLCGGPAPPPTFFCVCEY